MVKNGTYNGEKRVEAEQSSYYREYPVAFGQKREKVGVGQSDTAKQYTVDPMLFPSGNPLNAMKRFCICSL